MREQKQEHAEIVENNTKQLLTQQQHKEEKKQNTDEKGPTCSEYYETIFKNSPQAIIILDKKGNIVDCNQRVYDWLGYHPDEFIGNHVLHSEFINEESKTVIKKNFIKRMVGKHIDDYDLVFISRSGEEHIGRIHGIPLKNKKNKIIGDLVMVSDISEQIKAERAVNQQLSFNSLRARIWELSVTTKDQQELIQRLLNELGPFLQVNNASYCQIDHKNKKAVVTYQWKDKQAKSGIGQEIPYEQLKHIFGKNHMVVSPAMIPKLVRPLVIPLFKKYGTKSTLIVPFGDINKPDGFLSIADVTEQREWKPEEILLVEETSQIIQAKSTQLQTFHLLKESERQYRDLFENATDLIQSVNLDGSINYVNNAWKQTLGYSDDDVNKINIFDVIHPDHRKQCQKILKEIVKGEEKTNIETIFQTKSGESVFVEGNINCRVDQGKPVATRGIFRDVTKKKEFKSNLIRFQKAIECSSEAIGLADGYNKAFYLNPAFTSLSGFTPEEVNNMGGVIELYEDKRLAKKIIDDLIKGKSWNGEIILVTKNKKRIPVEVFTDVIWDDQGNMIGSIGIHSNISKRKEIEEILNAAGGGIRIIDKDFKIISSNETYAEMTRVSMEESKGMICKDVFKSIHCGTENCALRKVLQTGKSYHEERLMTTRDGKTIPCLTKITPYKNQKEEIIGIIEDYRDISSLKKVEVELNKAYEVLNTSPAVAFTWQNKPGWPIEYVSKNVKNLVGYSAEELIEEKKSFEELIYDEDKKRVSHEIETYFSDKNCSEFTQVYRIQTKNKEIKWVDDRTTLQRGRQGSVVKINGVILDITDRKMAEERYKILFNSSRDALMTIAPPNWKFTSANPATLKLFETNVENEYLAKGPGDVSPEYQPDGSRSSEKAKKMIQNALDKGSHYFEWTHQTLKGNEFPAIVLLTRIDVEGGQPFIQATVRDISNEKKAEKQLKDKINELERYKKVTVGRELKMMELKKRIKELEGIQNNHNQ